MMAWSVTARLAGAALLIGALWLCVMWAGVPA